ncbi:MAG: response regulator [Pyrinomonadaceae bacterium]
MTRPKLLLADDSVTVRKVVQLTFTDEGIDVAAVADSNSAMQKFVEIQPDIVLVDVGLPGISGYQICEMIKQDEATKHIPVLLLVGSFEPFDDAEADRVKADGFLTKPFQSIRDLVSRVKELLGTEQPSQAEQDPVNATDDPREKLPPTGADTVDIEDLYKSSFAVTAEIEEFDTVDDLLGDPGMDDEMIEATYLSDSRDERNAKEPAEPVEPAQPMGHAEPVEPAQTFDWSPESRVSEIAMSTAETAPESAAIPEEPGAMDQETSMAAEDEPSLETVAEKETVSYDRYDHGQLIHEVRNDSSIDSAEVDFGHLRRDENADAAISQTFDEQPFSAQGKQGSEPDAVTDSSVSTEPQEPSPEFISLVTQRVLEKLSDRLIREIAQEAVPRITEKLIREALEQDKRT